MEKINFCNYRLWQNSAKARRTHNNGRLLLSDIDLEKKRNNWQKNMIKAYQYVDDLLKNESVVLVCVQNGLHAEHSIVLNLVFTFCVRNQWHHRT
jgi:predicted dehydrogenase